MKKTFEIKEIKQRLFLFEFKERYELCMHFLRYQEFYESISPKFRGKAFEIFDFMKWYSLTFGRGAFTYADDWNGFNIPGDTIKKVWDLHINDKNAYDYEMKEAWKHCYDKSGGNKFYIIGVVKGNSALEHEIAHGMFYLHPNYKNSATKLVNNLGPNIRGEMNSQLKKMGYTSKVYIDETQAYMSTGLTKSFGDITKWNNERQIFQDHFKKFIKSVK